MYVAVKGGEKAIDAAHQLLDEQRRGDPDCPSLSLKQISEQLGGAVDRVMLEGSLYDEELAALAIKQAAGDLVEAVFLLRAYRATLPRFGYAEPLKTDEMTVERRISATFKDIPGGQILGATFDYTHRLLDFDLANDERPTPSMSADLAQPASENAMASVAALLEKDGLMERSPQDQGAPPGDLTREPLSFPAPRDVRLQNLARADEGFLLALSYSTQRGFGRNHPFAGEIRKGRASLGFTPPELGFPIEIGEMEITECQMVTQFSGTGDDGPRFTRGYGVSFGGAERKAMAMAMADRALRAEELGEEVKSPAQDVEFVLSHSDNVEASGFVQHLKLPHYVDFQSELDLLRRLRAECAAKTENAA